MEEYEREVLGQKSIGALGLIIECIINSSLSCMLQESGDFAFPTPSYRVELVNERCPRPEGTGQYPDRQAKTGKLRAIHPI